MLKIRKAENHGKKNYSYHSCPGNEFFSCSDHIVRFHLHKSKHFHRHKKPPPLRFTQPECMLLSDYIIITPNTRLRIS